MGLKMVSETEVPSAPNSEFETATPSRTSSEHSPRLIAVLEEIRMVLSARASVLLAMAGAFGLTASAMWKGDLMSLAIALSFDVVVFIPIVVIAYRRPKE